VCKPVSASFSDLSRVATSPQMFNNDADKYDFWVGEGALNSTGRGSVLLPITQSGPLSQGTLLSSSRYMLYGKFSVKMKATAVNGLVSAAILFSDVQDEIDVEFPGNNTQQMQTNIFHRGVNSSAAYFGIPANGTRSEFHTYTVDWSPERIIWSIDDMTERTLLKSDANENYPTTPARVQFSTWNASPSPNAINNWAGGLTVWNETQYAAEIESVQISCYDTNQQPAGTTSYVYTDANGSVAYSSRALVYVAPPSSSLSSSSAAASSSSTVVSTPNNAGACPSISDDSSCNVLINACVKANAGSNPWAEPSCFVAGVCAGPDRLLSRLQCVGQTTPSQSSLNLDAKVIGNVVGPKCTSVTFVNRCSITGNDYMNYYYSQLSAVGTTSWPESSQAVIDKFWTPLAKWTSFPQGTVPYTNVQDYFKFYKSSTSVSSSSATPTAIQKAVSSSTPSATPNNSGSCPAISDDASCNTLVDACMKSNSASNFLSQPSCFVAGMCAGPDKLYSRFQCLGQTPPARTSLSLDDNVIAAMIGPKCPSETFINRCSISDTQFMNYYYATLNAVHSNTWPPSSQYVIDKFWSPILKWANPSYNSGSGLPPIIYYSNLRDYFRFYSSPASQSSTCSPVSSDASVNTVVDLCVRVGTLNQPFALHECLIAAIVAKPAPLLSYWACKTASTAPARPSLQLDYTNAYAPLVGQCAFASGGCPFSTQNFIDAFYGAITEAGSNQFPSGASSAVTTYWKPVFTWAGFNNGNVPYNNLQDYLRYYS